MRYVFGQPAEKILPSSAFSNVNHTFSATPPLGSEEKIRILVWNIFKQQRANWLPVLKNFSKGTHLVLLQEAQTTPELVDFATTNYLAADQVPAYFFPQHPSGVMTLSTAHPIYSYPFCEKEPIFRLAKSALVNVYFLSDARLLMVVNIHAVNFSFGLDGYNKQLFSIGKKMINHVGPIIMGGDFNTWSRQRINTLYEFSREMSLCEVDFAYDQRRKTFGRPLDFIFYRDLGIHEASVLVTRASDHNPLLAEFTTVKLRRSVKEKFPE